MTRTGTLDPGTLVGNGIDTVESGLTAIAPQAMLFAAGVMALYWGWQFAVWIIGLAGDLRGPGSASWGADERDDYVRDAARHRDI